MEQPLFVFSIIIDGTTEKLLQFIMSLKSTYNKKLGLIEQKYIFEHYREIQTRKCLLIDIIFVTKTKFWWTFQSCAL
jgi:hypothetical protein